MGEETRQLLDPSDALARFEPPADERKRTQSSEGSVRYGFLVGEIGLLIRRETVAELLEQATVFPIPKAPHWLRGLINLRGNLVPVYDLRALLDVTDEIESSAQRILILDRDDEMVGVLIDGLPRAIRDLGKPTTDIPPLPAVLKKHVTEAYAGKAIIWLEFDHRAFFLSVASSGRGADFSGSE